MSLLLENKLALVTGAASGLGLAISRAFVAEGASVILVDISESVYNVARELNAIAAATAAADSS